MFQGKNQPEGPDREPIGGKLLILGLGNDLVSDDGFGPAVVARCRGPEFERPDLVVEEASVAGFHLLDLMQGYARVLLVDVVMTGRYPPGTLLEWPLAAAGSGRTLGGSHQMDLVTTLTLGGRLGMSLPTEITLLVAEAQDLLTVREELTPELYAALPRAEQMVRDWISASGDFAPALRRSHDQARVLS
jgi:hydrogenase maturation protease